MTRFSAYALEWWLKNQGVTKDFKIDTRQANDDATRFEITLWEVPGIPKPTDQQIEQIIDQYEAFKSAEKSATEEEAAAILQKLGISKEEFKKLAGVLRD